MKLPLKTEYMLQKQGIENFSFSYTKKIENIQKHKYSMRKYVQGAPDDRKFSSNLV